MGPEPVESATGHPAVDAPLRPENAGTFTGARGLHRPARPAWRAQPIEPELGDPEDDQPSPFDAGDHAAVPASAGVVPAPEPPDEPEAESRHSHRWRQHRLYLVIAATVRACMQYRVTGLAAEAAFFGVLSLPPLVFGLAGSIGYVVGILGNQSVESVKTGLVQFAGRALTQDTVNAVVVPMLNAVLDRGRADVISIGFVLALWSGSRALNVFIDTVTIMYGMRGQRGIVKTRAISFSVYTVGLFVAVTVLPLLLAGPDLVHDLLPSSIAALADLYWPIVVALSMLLMTSLYHWAPPDRLPWRYGIPGALIVFGIWFGGSIFLRIFLSASIGGQSTSIYGPLAAPIVVLIWLYVIAIAVLIGAALNSAVAQVWPPRRLGRAEPAEAGSDAVVDADRSDDPGGHSLSASGGARHCARPGRRHAVTVGGGRSLRIGIAALAVLAAACIPVSGRTPGPAGLFADGLATTRTPGAVVVVPPRSGQTFVPGTRVLTVDEAAAGASAGVSSDRSWLAAGTVPGTSDLKPMNQQALLDLSSLTAPNGAVLAGSTPAWRYVWPRDASFAAAAYSATGHGADALRVLTYLASIAPVDGHWQARYLPDGSGQAPDHRGVQSDGGGWILWATGRYVADRLAAGQSTSSDVERLWPMVASSADAIARSLGTDGLPPASPDYWERHERNPTLGTVAPDLAGLQAAAGLATSTGRPADAQRWAAAAATLQAGMDRQFGTNGWHRTRGGEFDTAVTFTMEPFLGPATSATSAQADVVPRDSRLLDGSFAATVNANGGVRPGASWHRDGVSWTPETALFALAFAANGEPARASQLLTWLSAHRTGLGSLPEKVNPDGSPAAVAPLAWTCALVMLGSVELDSAAH